MNKKYLLRHGKQPFGLRGSVIMQRKFLPTVTETKQIKQNIEQGQTQTHTA